MQETAHNPTLAAKLGDIAHVSPLLRKLCRISGCPQAWIGEWLLKCAVQRGARHYDREFSKGLPPDNSQISDEEIGIALCLGGHAYNSVFIRAAAQLLSSPKINAGHLARLATMERADAVLFFISRIAQDISPETHPWAYLRQTLHPRKPGRADALPHWSRFVSQTGVTPFGGGPSVKWLGRCETIR